MISTVMEFLSSAWIIYVTLTSLKWWDMCCLSCIHPWIKSFCWDSFERSITLNLYRHFNSYGDSILFFLVTDGGSGILIDPSGYKHSLCQLYHVQYSLMNDSNHQKWTSTNLDKYRWIDVLNKMVEDFDLRREWVLLNCIRMGHGRCGDMKSKWWLINNTSCDCGHSWQTVEHIVF